MSRPFWLLATGTGRCGTGYMAHVLTSCGIKCSHEGIFQPDSEEETLCRLESRRAHEWWEWEAESSWMIAPWLGRPELEGMTVVHLVRHPKKVIDSQLRTLSFKEPWTEFSAYQVRHVPELEAMTSRFERAAHFYVRWNRMIEERADHFHRVEDAVEPLLDLLGIEWRDKDLYTNRRYNSRDGYEPSDVDLDSLPEPLRGELRAMCEGYGYEWPRLS